MEETYMNWFDILKNAKIRGKGKTGGKLDTSRLKVNVEDNSCQKDFNDWFIKQKELNETAFTSPIEVELTQAILPNKSMSAMKATEKEYCELLDFIKQPFPPVLESGLTMALRDVIEAGESRYTYIPFESSKGNIKIALDMQLSAFTIKMYMVLFFKTKYGTSVAIGRYLTFKSKDYNDGKKHISKYLKKLVFKW